MLPIFVLSLPGFSFAQKYDALRCRPLKSFMRNLAGWGDAEFAALKSPGTGTAAVTPEGPAFRALWERLSLERNERIGAGSYIFETRRGQIERFLKDFDKAISAPIPVFDAKRLDGYSKKLKPLDLVYACRIVLGLTSVANYFIAEKKYDDAVRMHLLLYRFGQAVAAGEGEPSSFECFEAGHAIRSASAEKALKIIAFRGPFLKSGAVFYLEALRKISADARGEMAFADLVKGQRLNMRRFFEEIPGAFEKKAAKMDRKQKNSRMKNIRAVTGKIAGVYDAAYSKEIEILASRAGDPAAFKSASEAVRYSAAAGRSEILRSSAFEPTDEFHSFMAALGFPDPGAFLDKFTQSGIKTRGLSLVCKIAARYMKYGELPFKYY